MSKSDAIIEDLSVGIDTSGLEAHLEESTPALGSLAARIAERRREIDNATTELFDVPKYADVFRLELRRLPLKRLVAIAQSVERIHDDALRALYSMADTILAATVAFHEVRDDGSTRPAPGLTWQQLAHAYDPNLDESVQPRVALLRIIGDAELTLLFQDYQTWLRNGSPRAEKELERDFPRTP